MAANEWMDGFHAREWYLTSPRDLKYLTASTSKMTLANIIIWSSFSVQLMSSCGTGQARLQPPRQEEPTDHPGDYPN